MNNSSKSEANQYKFLLSLFVSLFLIAFFVITLAIIIGYIPINENSGIDKILLIITISGAIGGILFAIHDRKLELPALDSLNNENSIKLGFVADILIGISGAYIIFLIIPDIYYPSSN